MRRLLPLLLLAGCLSKPTAPAAPSSAPSSTAPTSAPSSTAPTSSIPSPRAQTPTLWRYRAQLMGTPWQITIAGAPEAQAKAAADAAFTEVARVEQAMSEWLPLSDLGRVNAAAGQVEPVVISAETFALITRAQALSVRTHGAFDITWAALRGLWRFKGPPKLPKKSALLARLKRVGYQKVQLNKAQHSVRLPEAGMALGLGGIAKGYAIDRAAAVLRERGLSRFIVDGGGDLYLAGEKAADQPWTVGLRHPRRDALLASLVAKDVAVVSSGDYERFFELGGRRYHHIIDVKTGMPARLSVAVTVRAAEATLADALATAIFVLGPQAGIELAEGMDGVEAVVLGPKGDIFTTTGLRSIFEVRRWRD